MIVWGGYFFDQYGEHELATGGRYDPLTDTWRATASGPPGRADHSAVWTGTEMIVWGGDVYYETTGDLYFLQNAGRYDPATDTWRPEYGPDGVPAGRAYHTGIWTGTEMIVWGGLVWGHSITTFDTGGRYCGSCGTNGNGDPDLDGVCSPADNCPDIFNPDQLDGDHNGIGDVCEPDALFGDANLSTEGFSSNRIDGRDLFLFAEAYGTCPGDAGHSVRANLDHVPTGLRACVDAEDLHLFLNQFGKSR